MKYTLGYWQYGYGKVIGHSMTLATDGKFYAESSLVAANDDVRLVAVECSEAKAKELSLKIEAKASTPFFGKPFFCEERSTPEELFAILTFEEVEKILNN